MLLCRSEPLAAHRRAHAFNSKTETLSKSGHPTSRPIFGVSDGLLCSNGQAGWLEDLRHGGPRHCRSIGQGAATAILRALASLGNVSAEEAVKRTDACECTVSVIGAALILLRVENALRNDEGVSSQDRATRATEDALIAKVLSGQREAFMALVRPYQRTVYATALSLLGNNEDAEDIVQNALLKALSRLSQFRRESMFGTWLVQITINEVRMRRRRDRRLEMVSLGFTPEDEKNYVPKDFQDWREIPSEALERTEIREMLLKALGSIAQHYREAFVLRDIQELSIAQTATILGISRGAVKTRLHRARLMLRDILAPGFGQDGRLGWSVREIRRPWE